MCSLKFTPHSSHSGRDAPQVPAEHPPPQTPGPPELTAGEMIHDLSNSLVGVKMVAERLVPMLAGVPDAAELARVLEGGLQEALDLCECLRTSTNLQRTVRDRGSGTRRIDLGSLVRSSSCLLHNIVPPAVRIVYQLTPQPAQVAGREAHLRQVLMNLVSNAADALGRRGGRITISTRVAAGKAAAEEPFQVRAGRFGRGPYVCLQVSDNGEGIPEALLGKVFQPGFTTKSTGHGDGLPSVRKIVEACGGAVTLISDPGQGTTIRAYLPCISHSPPVATPAPGSTTVLLVEDHESIRVSSKQLLESGDCGRFEVLTCATGEAAVESLLARTADVAVAVLDMNLPDCQGLDLLAALRRIKPALPVIAVSGFDRRHFAWQGAEQPDLFLPKPFGMEELVAKLYEVLKKDSVNGSYTVRE